jgi:hypothetical protein
MDALYSIALLLSLVCGVEAVTVAVLDRFGFHPVEPLARFLLPACLIAWGSLAVSVGVHFNWGHAPGSPEALPPMAFLREHTAFSLAAVLPALALALRKPRGGSARETTPA